MNANTNSSEPGQEQTGRLSFDALSLSEELRRALDEMGYVKPTPVQQATFEPAVQRRDIIVQARTGTGKTAAFGIPIIDRIVRDEPHVQVLVLAPTRELALQSTREMQSLGKYRKVRTAAVYGGAPMGRQINELANGARIVSGTPGRVLDHLKRGTLDASHLRVLVLDEMDEMLSMGFARELNAILDLIPSKRQTMCFSATVDEAVHRLARKHMQDPEFISLSTDAVSPEEVAHYVFIVSGKDRVRDLIRILETEDPESALIFCNQRSETQRVAAELQQAGFNADWLNGDLPQHERERVMSRTREGKLRYLVATDVAARGIDISHLTHIINYTFPEAAVSYVHRTGRTGRAGRTGTAISLVSPRELGELYYLRLEYKIFPIERSLPTTGELKTRQEADRIELLNQAFDGEPSSSELSLARRLLSHPGAERVVSGLLRTFFGSRGVEVDEEAAASRRARPPRAVSSPEPDKPKAPPRRGSDAPAVSQARPRRRRERTAAAIPEEPTAAGPRAPEGEAEAPSSEPVGTIFLNIGRKDGLRLSDINKLLREHCGLAKADVKRVRMRDRYTFVDLPEPRVEETVGKLTGLEISGRELAPERAKVSKA